MWRSLVSLVAGSKLTVQKPLANLVSAQASADELDPEVSSRQFLHTFERKYGLTHPTFVQGSYRTALERAKDQFRLLILYLHSEDHEDTNSFCRHTLCSRAVADFIDDNFLMWAGSVSSYHGNKASNIVGATTFPTLVVLCPTQNTYITGKLSGEELIEQLSTVMEEQSDVLTAARAESEQIQRNRELIEEQDRAFLEALNADRERERAEHEREERQRRMKEQEERELHLQKQQAEQRCQKEQEMRDEKAARLPPEPGPESTARVTRIAIRLPDATRLQRRFKSSDTLQSVFDFIDASSDAHDLQMGSYSLVSNFPRKVFEESHLTLEECGLDPEALLFIQEKDF